MPPDDDLAAREENLGEVLTRMPGQHRRHLAALLGICPLPGADRAPDGSLPTFARESFLLLPPEGQAAIVERELLVAGGHAVANWARGGAGPTYPDVVRGVVKYVGARVPDGASVPELESSIVRRTFKRIFDAATLEARDRLAESLEELAAEHGKSFEAAGGVLAAVGAAHLSGFSVYVLATSLAGGVTSALGVTLPLGFYFGLTKALSVLLGPAGLVTIGVASLLKAGGPSMSKVFPAVMMVAATRFAPPDSRIGVASKDAD